MKKRIGLIAGGIIILVLGVMLYLNMTVKGAVTEGRIIDGVECDGVNLGGMTKEEAQKAVENHIKKLHKEKITLYIDDEETEASIEQLGAIPDSEKTAEEAYALGRSGNIFHKYSIVKEDKHMVGVYRNYDKAVFEKKLTKITKNIITAPKNATVKRKNGKFIVQKEKTGYTLKMDATFKNFKKAIESNKTKAKLEVSKKKAKYTSEDLKKIKDVMGTYTTEYGSSPYGRKVNVANGASKINGKVIYPGETFSVYETVSPFTAENGYALAGSYENGQTVQTYGGGICQVSTTLYNAVIRAELKIKERHPHSMTVHYVPRSADAAIAGTYKDMKFENQNDFPVYIEGHANGSTITFTVYGIKEDPDRTVEFVSETTSVKESTGEKIIQDPTLEKGQKILEQSGHTGYTARLWKIVKINGKQKSKKVFNTSSYMATPATYREGTKQKEDKKKKKDQKTTENKKDQKTTESKKTTSATTTAAKQETKKPRKNSNNAR